MNTTGRKPRERPFSKPQSDFHPIPVPAVRFHEHWVPVLMLGLLGIPSLIGSQLLHHVETGTVIRKEVR